MKKAVYLFIILIFICQQSSFAKERIISLAPSQTELLYAIGAGNEIVGVSNYSDYPEEAKSIPTIGGVELNIEKIVSLSPTVLIDANSMRNRYEPLFKSLNLKYLNYIIKTPEDNVRTAIEIGKIIGKEKEAKIFAYNWLEQLNKLKQKKKHFTFYAEIWHNPMQAASKNSFISKIIEEAGGINVINDILEYPTVNQEIILNLNPEVIFLCYPVQDNTVSEIKQRPAWNYISAVKNNKVFAVNQDYFVRPGPRNLDGIQQIINLLGDEK